MQSESLEPERPAEPIAAPALGAGPAPPERPWRRRMLTAGLVAAVAVALAAGWRTYWQQVAIREYNRGVVANDAGNFREAVERFTAAAQRDPHLASAYAGRAAALWRLGEFERARADCETALRLAPNNVAALVNRSAIRLQAREFAEAASDCSAAIEIDPTAEQAWLNRAVAHLGLNEIDRAIDDYSGALAAAGRGT